MATVSTSARLRLLQLGLGERMSQRLSERLPDLLQDVIDELRRRGARREGGRPEAAAALPAGAARRVRGAVRPARRRRRGAAAGHARSPRSSRCCARRSAPWPRRWRRATWSRLTVSPRYGWSSATTCRGRRGRRAGGAGRGADARRWSPLPLAAGRVVGGSGRSCAGTGRGACRPRPAGVRRPIASTDELDRPLLGRAAGARRS